MRDLLLPVFLAACLSTLGVFALSTSNPELVLAVKSSRPGLIGRVRFTLQEGTRFESGSRSFKTDVAALAEVVIPVEAQRLELVPYASDVDRGKPLWVRAWLDLGLRWPRLFVTAVDLGAASATKASDGETVYRLDLRHLLLREPVPRLVRALVWSGLFTGICLVVLLIPRATRSLPAAPMVGVLLGVVAALGFGLSFLLLPELTGKLRSRSIYDLNLVDSDGETLTGRTGGVLVRLDPFTGYRNFPNHADSHYRTDAWGYRVDANRTSPRPQAAIVLGGSAAFGWGIEDYSHTFSGQLDQLVPALRFHNAAVISWKSGQELGEVAHYAERLSPATYVSFSGFNDFFYRGRRGLGYNEEVLDAIEARLRLALSPFHVSSEWPASDDARAEVKDSEVVDTYWRNLKSMSQIIQGRGAKFLVVLQPELGSRKFPTAAERLALAERATVFRRKRIEDFSTRYRRAMGEIESRCRAAGIEVLNLVADRDVETSRDSIFLDFVHPSVQGHRLIAQKIARRLRRM